MANSLDELLASEKPDVVRRAKIKADRILLEIRLSEVRALLEKTQKDMAEASLRLRTWKRQVKT